MRPRLAVLPALIVLVCCTRTGPGESGEGLDATARHTVGPDANVNVRNLPDGAECVEDLECTSGLCASFGGRRECSTFCGSTAGCDRDGYVCFARICTPATFCDDLDEDRHGIGPGCEGSDCNDRSASVYAGAVETCNRVDDDCSGVIDDLDADHDGYSACPGITDHDCDDDNADAYPDHPETCNGIDDNCNGLVDEEVKLIFYADADGDGAGDPATWLAACSAPAGYVANAHDCNDLNGDIYPDAPETCNGIDDDCNGVPDDGLPQVDIYADPDGDGFASPGLPPEQRCAPPLGFVMARDVNGDSAPDWDCDGTDGTVYPGAPTRCGDGKDNNCDGIVDRLCFESCEGNWPYRPQYVFDLWTGPYIIDMDGDGRYETVVNDSFAFAILDTQGVPLYETSEPVHHQARGRFVAADIDDYDHFDTRVQTQELFIAGKRRVADAVVFQVRLFKLNADHTVTTYEQDVPVQAYDASQYLVSDIDHDGAPEFLAGSWCDPAAGTLFYRFNKTTEQITEVARIADPEGACEYGWGRTLTDLDGDGRLEYVFGNGLVQDGAVSAWRGHLFADRFTDLSTLATAPYCPAGTCFSTSIAGLYGAGLWELIRMGDEVQATVGYYTTNTPGGPNTEVDHFWRFAPDGSPVPGAPWDSGPYDGWTNAPVDPAWYPVDVDDDGVPESFFQAVDIGLYDVNGDGYPDRISTGDWGTELTLELWDNTQKKYVENAPSRRFISEDWAWVTAAWDMDADGRLEVISMDGAGETHCHKLGPRTWNKYASLPPHQTPLLYTAQWDNFEPNEGRDTDADGMPDEYIQIPSSATRLGNFYSFLSSPTDKDYFLVDTSWGSQICLTPPKGRTYKVRVYSFKDVINNTNGALGADGLIDGFIKEVIASNEEVCFDAWQTAPIRTGEYKLIIGISSADGDYSASWPYWLHIPK